MEHGSKIGFMNFLKRRRTFMNPSQRKASIKKKPKRVKWPHKYENQMTSFLTQYNQRIFKIFNSWFQSKLPIWRERRKRMDSWESELELFLHKFSDDIDVILQDSKVIGIDLSRKMNEFFLVFYEFSKSEVGQEIERFLGAEYYGSEHWYETVRQEWINVFKERTKKVTVGFVEKVREVVYKGVQKNQQFETIIANIEQAGKTFTKSKANFIARDLIGSLNATLMKNMHTSIGLNYYMWQTMADERVRGRPGGRYPYSVPNHWEMEGKICTWDDPTIYSLDGYNWLTRTATMPKYHPGQDWACRCLPGAYFVPLLNEVDRQII